MAIYTDENGMYQFDFNNALWSTDAIHNYYQDSNHTYGEIGFLCDVDFAFEDDTNIWLVEYKNANVPNAANPGAFNPISGNKLENVAKKFYNSLHFLYLSDKTKPRKYIYLVEYPRGNPTSRLLVRNALQKKLPFALQRSLDTGKKLIEEVRVINIAEWNADVELKNYPITPVQVTASEEEAGTQSEGVSEEEAGTESEGVSEEEAATESEGVSEVEPASESDSESNT